MQINIQSEFTETYPEPITKLYRACNKKEIIKLFTDKFILPIDKKYISLSKDDFIFDESISFGRDNDYLVVYNAEEIFAQGGEEIEYTEYFMFNHPHYLEHLLGHKSIQELVDHLRATGQDETPDEYIDLYYSEQEVAIPRIDFKSGLVIDIIKKEGQIEDEIYKLLYSLTK